MFQQMMGSIREETVGFLFNLEVEVAPQAGVAGATIEAKGLGRQGASDDKLSYSAPSDSGGVEVRNQRGQVQQAATQRARRAVGGRPRRPRPRRPRGAFGQRTEGGGDEALRRTAPSAAPRSARATDASTRDPVGALHRPGSLVCVAATSSRRRVPQRGGAPSNVEVPQRGVRRSAQSASINSARAATQSTPMALARHR